MCAPAALGVASFASGALGAVGQYQSGQAQASAANAGAMRQYKYQLKMRENNWLRERERYQVGVANYQQAVADNQDAAQRAYVSQQEKLNNIYRSTSFRQQAQLIELAQGSSKRAATGQRGRSVNRLDNDIVSQFGRNQAIMAESLLSAQRGYNTAVGGIRREQLSANNRAYSPIAIAPKPDVAPPAPVMQQGPSALSLLAGIGSAAVDGYGTYNSLKPPAPQPYL